MLNWSGPGPLGMNQKGAEYYILDESHLGKLQCISVKIMFERGYGEAPGEMGKHQGPHQKQICDLCHFSEEEPGTQRNEVKFRKPHGKCMAEPATQCRSPNPSRLHHAKSAESRPIEITEITELTQRNGSCYPGNLLP